MATTVSYSGVNRGIQVGVVYGNIESLTIAESLDQECLRALRTTDPHHDKERIKDAKGGLLKDCYRWILDNGAFKQWQQSESNSHRLLWIRGDPGKGKTMLLCGIIEELTYLYGDNTIISFFFCQATDNRINSATSVLRGLIYLLVEKNPSLLSHVRSQYDKAGRALFEDVNAWSALITIFTSILEDSSLKAAYIVIDALDECTSGLDSLLKLIVQKSAAHPRIKWLISSRNYANIIKRLNSTTQSALLLELNEASVSEAVKFFIEHRVNTIAGIEEYSPETCNIVKEHLMSHSQGTFLWVALVCKELEGTEWWQAEDVVRTFPPGLSALYRQMLDQVYKTRSAQICKQILSIICSVYRPITLSELGTLIQGRIDRLDIDAVILRQLIGLCGSFIILREQKVHFIHQSAKDFLTQKASSEILPNGAESEHHAIFSQCLSGLMNTLRRDIFNIRLPGIPIEDINIPSLNPLASVEYACIYWVDHLYAGRYNAISKPDLKNKDTLLVDMFLQHKLLHWLEALSILKSLSDGIHAIKRLESLIQVYCSPLIFSPSKSLTRAAFEEERPNWISRYPIIEDDWSACLQTLERHSGCVMSIAWSPDVSRSRLASGSFDTTVRIWDPITGQNTSTLEGHSGWVISIAWSPDGSRLASGSIDTTVRIWDPITGQNMSTLKGHSGWVTSITWSPDGSRLISGSDDATVCIWDPITGQNISPLEGDKDLISARSIAWSPDGSRLASGLYDTTVRIWNPITGQNISTLYGHTNSVTSITWSPDGSQLVSGSYDNTIRVWDAKTSQNISTLKGHSDSVMSVAWSPDGGRLASGSYDTTVRIWDPITGQNTSTLEGHSGWVMSITWSPDGSRLASGSDDTTVRIWDPIISLNASTLKGYSNSVISTVACSPDGSQFASGSDSTTVQIWDPITGLNISTLNRYSDSVISTITWLPNRSRLALGSDDNIVQVWDPIIDHNTYILKGHSGCVTSIAWSPDGNQLASGSDDTIVRIWDHSTGQNTALAGHRSSITLIAWSPDGNRLASGSDDTTVRIWDPSTGQNIALAGHRSSITLIAWSPDGSRIASGSEDNTVRIWNSVTSQCISTLRTGRISFLEFDTADPNYNYIKTNVGIFDRRSMVRSTCTSDSSVQPFNQNRYGLNHDRSWVTCNGLQLLWLPSEYRPTDVLRFAVHATTVAIVRSRNRVIFLEFSTSCPILSS
ncbi:hypothetical protein N7454_005461 [Penicillium verhagenii]|nr:hypothetical protein N7454_005461 [Penicillium verhagenii]